jgi:hypothetical protein
MSTKELFVALLGGEVMSSPKELSSNIHLFSSKADLDYIKKTLNDEITGNGETLVGAIVTSERILTIVHRDRNTNYRGSNGYIGSSHQKSSAGTWSETEAYAWNEEYEVDKSLATELEKLFGRPAFFI